MNDEAYIKKRYFKTYPIIERAYCVDCDSELELTNETKMMGGFSILYKHICNTCHVDYWLFNKYPMASLRHLKNSAHEPQIINSESGEYNPEDVK